jgi:hypothetical protein
MPPIASGFPFPTYGETSRCLYGQFIKHNNKINYKTYIEINIIFILPGYPALLFIVKGKGQQFLYRSIKSL